MANEERADDIARDIIDVMLRPMEKRLKLPQGYCMALGDEPNDWVFIAKLGLLVEASLTEYLVAEIGRRETYDHVSAIDQSKRLMLAKMLGVLSDEERALLQMLSEVRNEFVHRLENLNRPLATYIESLKQGRKNHIASVLLSARVRKAVKDEGVDVNEMLPDRFRALLLTQTMFPLITMSSRQHRKESERERSEWGKVSDRHASFAFNLPPNAALTIEEPPDGKPGPGLEGFKAKPSEEG